MVKGQVCRRTGALQCLPILTYAKRIFLELRGEVGDVSQAVEVSLQNIPAHLVVEWVSELCWNLEEEDRNRF